MQRAYFEPTGRALLYKRLARQALEAKDGVGMQIQQSNPRQDPSGQAVDGKVTNRIYGRARSLSVAHGIALAGRTQGEKGAV